MTGYIKQVIESNDEYSLVLITWQPGSFTPVHGHGESDCLFEILRGELTTTVNSKTTVLKKGDLSHINDSIGKHSMMNRTDKEAVSLHKYTPPLQD